jgi:diketogulonate reductase-like aldo/keto reductase
MVVTKIHPRGFAEMKLRESVQRSRSLIYRGLDDNRPLDVVLLHSPWCWRGHCTPEEERVPWQQAWATLESLKGSGPGQVQAIGVSNFDENTLKELMDIANKKVSVVQNWMDVFHQDTTVREMCRDNGIVYMYICFRL